MMQDTKRDYWFLYGGQWPEEWLINVIHFYHGSEDSKVVGPTDIDEPDRSSMEYLVWKVDPDESNDMSGAEILNALAHGDSEYDLPLIPDDDEGLDRAKVEEIIMDYEKGE